MRKRQLKKYAKGAKKNRGPYAKARGKGSKKDCRRFRAFRRLSGWIRRDRDKKITECQDALKNIDSYVPANSDEASELKGLRSSVQRALDLHLERRSQDRLVDSTSRSLAAQVLTVKQYVENYARSIG